MNLCYSRIFQLLGRKMLHIEEIEGEQRILKPLDSLSFLKQLFFGRFDASKIFPYPRPHLEERERIDLFCHRLRQFCESHVDPIEIDRQSKISDEIIHSLGKLGMFGLLIPQNFGGLGMSETAFCKAQEVVSQRCASLAAFITANHVAAKAILLYGNKEQKQKWLPPIAKGEIMPAFALVEPHAGSDMSAIETKAAYDSTKNIFYATGKKLWVTSGSFAKIIILTAKTEFKSMRSIKQNVTTFIVTPDMPGFRVLEANIEKVGLRGLQVSTLEFDNLQIPAENILGKLGEGLPMAFSLIASGRISFSASCMGPSKFLVDQSYKYARDRYQYQKPLASFPSVKNKLAFLAAFSYAIDAMTYLTAGKIDGGEKDFLLEAAAIKVFSTESLWKMIFESMQIFGGKSILAQYPYELMMRDCRPCMIVAGSNDVLRLFIANAGVREVSEHFNEFYSGSFLQSENILKGFQHLKRLLWMPKIDLYSSLLKKEAKMLGREIKRFGKSVTKLLWHYKGNVISKQLDLEKIAVAAIFLYAACAAISKLDSDLERTNDNTELLGDDIETAKFFCLWACQQVRFTLQTLFDPKDLSAEKLADRLSQDL